MSRRPSFSWLVFFRLHAAAAVVAMCMPACSALSHCWNELGEMNHGRGEHGNAVVDGKIYAMGGIFNSTAGPSEVERFDPATGQWTVLGQFPADRVRHHFMIGSSVYGDEIWDRWW